MESKKISLMKSGTCPNCGGSEIHSGASIQPKGAFYNVIPISLFILTELDNYVCVECGYVESYVADRAKLEKIKRMWAKVR